MIGRPVELVIFRAGYGHRWEGAHRVSKQGRGLPFSQQVEDALDYRERMHRAARDIQVHLDFFQK